ncbi:hypothetical protein PVAND_001105 [Polypedilum vanderplanki]|uniref:Uncharacterized protein n=1 Tax=Polypedilum vanderplanki TaxID=319348 RepID=A0A9J6BMC1_POLVA|nr:hypothetical protein PVAND_001105 [Polypedilum vanderplanki]
MDQIDIDCVACGCEIRDDQQKGLSVCGHGLMHYNCSYLSAHCSTCNQLLTIRTEHHSMPENFIQNQFTTAVYTTPPIFTPIPYNMNLNQQSTNRGNISSEFAEIKRMVLAMRTQLMIKLNEMSTEIENIKHSIFEQQKELIKMKLEAVQKEMKDIKINGSAHNEELQNIENMP